MDEEWNWDLIILFLYYHVLLETKVFFDFCPILNNLSSTSKFGYNRAPIDKWLLGDLIK